MDGVWLAGLILACLVGVVLTVVRLPGTWLIVLGSTVVSWHFGWSRPRWQVLAILMALAVVAEIVELVASAVSARQAGASKRASWWALIGGIAGMFVFTIPLPVIGTILGGLMGCFIGATIAELTLKQNVAQGAKVGLFATIGQVVGMVAKTMISLLMAATAILTAIRSAP